MLMGGSLFSYFFQSHYCLCQTENWAVGWWPMWIKCCDSYYLSRTLVQGVVTCFQDKTFKSFSVSNKSLYFDIRKKMEPVCWLLCCLEYLWNVWGDRVCGCVCVCSDVCGIGGLHKNYLDDSFYTEKIIVLHWTCRRFAVSQCISRHQESITNKTLRNIFDI